MTKRLVKEIVREYDESGNLIRETVTETTEDDDTVYYPYYVPSPYGPAETPNPFWSIEPTCTCGCTDNRASGMMYLE